jgi:hypothetical protein
MCSHSFVFCHFAIAPDALWNPKTFGIPGSPGGASAPLWMLGLLVHGGGAAGVSRVYHIWLVSSMDQEVALLLDLT